MRQLYIHVSPYNQFVLPVTVMSEHWVVLWGSLVLSQSIWFPHTPEQKCEPIRLDQSASGREICPTETTMRRRNNQCQLDVVNDDWQAADSSSSISISAWILLINSFKAPFFEHYNVDNDDGCTCRGSWVISDTPNLLCLTSTTIITVTRRRWMKENKSQNWLQFWAPGNSLVNLTTESCCGEHPNLVSDGAERQ